MDRPALREEDEAAFLEGRRLVRQGLEEEALIEFLKVIDQRAESPESHLEAGRIYLETLKQPIFAIYHFTKYLEFRPDSREAPTVRDLINTATKDFARSLPGRPFEELSGNDDILRALEQAREENLRLRRALAASERQVEDLNETIASLREQIASLAVPGSTPPAITNNPQPRPPGVNQAPANPPRTFTVRPGDSLSSISRAVYGTSARWRDIFEANRNILRNPNDLRVGQVLQVPQ